MTRWVENMDGMGVEDRGIGGGGDDMGTDGDVESFPEVVYGVRSSNSGKSTRQVFFVA